MCYLLSITQFFITEYCYHIMHFTDLIIRWPFILFPFIMYPPAPATQSYRNLFPSSQIPNNLYSCKTAALWKRTGAVRLLKDYQMYAHKGIVLSWQRHLERCVVPSFACFHYQLCFQLLMTSE